MGEGVHPACPTGRIPVGHPGLHRSIAGGQPEHQHGFCGPAPVEVRQAPARLPPRSYPSIRAFLRRTVGAVMKRGAMAPSVGHRDRRTRYRNAASGPGGWPASSRSRALLSAPRRAGRVSRSGTAGHSSQSSSQASAQETEFAHAFGNCLSGSRSLAEWRRKERPGDEVLDPAFGPENRAAEQALVGGRRSRHRHRRQTSASERRTPALPGSPFTAGCCRLGRSSGGLGVGWPASSIRRPGSKQGRPFCGFWYR